MLTSLTALDHGLFWFVNSHHCGFFDVFFSVVTWLGTAWVVTPALLAAIFIRAPGKKRLSLIVASALVLSASGIVNSQLKLEFHSPRPVTVFGDTVHVVGEKLTQNSFPSGHTNTAFTAAALLAFFFGRKFLPALLVACLVGYSRMYLGVHFPSDVVGGALLGIIFAWAGFSIFRWIETRKNPEKAKNGAE
jgi:undecaprenyl-diphosphatase